MTGAELAQFASTDVSFLWSNPQRSDGNDMVQYAYTLVSMEPWLRRVPREGVARLDVCKGDEKKKKVLDVKQP